MVIDNRHDAILVKIMYFDKDTKEEEIVSSYYTTAMDQTLKMFITAKEYEAPCYFNEFSEVIDEKFSNFPGWIIKDVYLKFGSSEDLPSIEVWI